MLKTWKVFTQSSEPEAHVKMLDKLKNTKQDKKWIMYIQILRKT